MRGCVSGFICLVLVSALTPCPALAARQAKVVAAVAGAYLAPENQDERPARVADPVDQATALVTDAHGQLSVLLPDYMLLKLDSATRFVYLGAATEGSGTISEERGELLSGRVWLRGRARPTPSGTAGGYSVRTPTATAAIRGTEWYMEVAEDGTTTVGVVDGQVEVVNDLGRLLLAPGEIALVAPGAPPVRAAYVVPENAVNWTLRYDGLWDKGDRERFGAAFSETVADVLAAYRANDLTTAFARLRETRAAGEMHAGWQALAGFLNLVSGRDAQARTYLTQAAAADPDWAWPLAHLALMDVVENKLQAGHNRAEAARRVEPGSAVATLALAYVAKAELDMDRAYALAREASLQAEEMDEASLAFARFALETRETDAARKALAELAGVEHLAGERAMLLGFLALSEGDNTGALALFRQAEAIAPDEPDALLGLGIALFNLNGPGQEEEGLEALARASVLAPQVAAYQAYLAKAFYETQNQADADAALARARRLDPKDPTPYLYEALLLKARHQPGRAVRALYEAQRLNGNRAVFRSRYLLDQDEAVLMANVAQVYKDLGFDRVSTRIAARALETDPTNEGAYRRLYFALQNDPRRYIQASQAALLAAKLHTPTTRTGVLFDDNQLSSYSETFAQTGADVSLRGAYLLYRTSDTPSVTESEQRTLSGALAAKADGPLAGSLVTGASLSEVDGRSGSQTTLPGDGTIHDTATSDVNSDLQFVRSLAKWRPTNRLGVFGELNGSFSQTDAAVGFDSELQFPGAEPFLTSSRTTSDTDTRELETVLGARYQLPYAVQLMLHGVQNRATSESDSQAESTFDSSATTIETENRYHLAQGALLKSYGPHHLQLGLRYLNRKNGVESLSNTTYGETTSRDELSYELASAHAVGSVLVPLLGRDVRVTGGLFHDAVSYERHGLGKHEETFWSVAAGFSTDLTDQLTLRAAYVESQAGDQTPRLQPVMIAGFPLLSANISDAYRPEEILLLKNRSLAAAIDYTLPDAPVFLGFEVSQDEDETSRFADDGSGRVGTENHATRLSAYLEALLTERLAASLAYTWADLALPADQDEQIIEAGLAYFFDSGLWLGLDLELSERRAGSSWTEQDNDVKVVLEPSLTYHLSTDLKLELGGHYEHIRYQESSGDGEKPLDQHIWWIESAVTLYF